MDTSDLTELHYFGIPTAFFDLFPKGVPVVIRTVPATAEFCFLYPSMADLALQRISRSEFLLWVSADALVTSESLSALELLLVLIGEAAFPVSIQQAISTQQAMSSMTPVERSQDSVSEAQRSATRDTSHVPSHVQNVEFLIEVIDG